MRNKESKLELWQSHLVKPVINNASQNPHHQGILGFCGRFFHFNKSLNYKGETWSTFTLKKKKSGIFKVTVFQEVIKVSGTELLWFDPIYKGKIKNVEDTDDLTNFVGSIKLKK